MYVWWSPLGHVGFGVLFNFFSLFSFDWVISKFHQVVYLFCLPLDLLCCKFCFFYFILLFSFYSLNSSAPEFLFGSFYYPHLFVKFLILFMYCFSHFVELSFCFLIRQLVSQNNYFQFFFNQIKEFCTFEFIGRLLSSWFSV